MSLVIRRPDKTLVRVEVFKLVVERGDAEIEPIGHEVMVDAVLRDLGGICG